MSTNFDFSYFTLLTPDLKNMIGDYMYGNTSMRKESYDASDKTTPLKITLFAPQNIMKTYTDYSTKMKSLNERKLELRTKIDKFSLELYVGAPNDARTADWETKTSHLYTEMHQIKKKLDELAPSRFKDALRENLHSLMIELLGGEEIYNNLPTYSIGFMKYVDCVSLITPESMSHSIMRTTHPYESNSTHRIIVRLKEGEGKPYVRTYCLHHTNQNWVFRNVLDNENSKKLLDIDGPIKPTELLDLKELLTKGTNSKGETLV